MSQDALKDFGLELWTHDPQSAQEYTSMIEEVRRESHFNKYARNLLLACAWIAGHTEKTIVERLDKMIALGELETPAIINLQHWTGWTT
jgi:hypothetical protein